MPVQDARELLPRAGCGVAELGRVHACGAALSEAPGMDLDGHAAYIGLHLSLRSSLQTAPTIPLPSHEGLSLAPYGAWDV